MAGIKIALKDPTDVSKVIHAEFATARSFPILKDLMRKIAQADTQETIVSRKKEIAETELQNASTMTEVEVAQAKLLEIVDEVTEAGITLFEAIREFVVMGYKLAGATKELAEELADLTDVEMLPIIKAKCLLGAGVLDFTKAESL